MQILGRLLIRDDKLSSRDELAHSNGSKAIILSVSLLRRWIRVPAPLRASLHATNISCEDLLEVLFVSVLNIFLQKGVREEGWDFPRGCCVAVGVLWIARGRIKAA